MPTIAGSEDRCQPSADPPRLDLAPALPYHDEVLRLTLACLMFLSCAQAQAKVPPSGFTLITWNVWSSTEGRKDRIPALLSAIERADPDIVCLQEVTPWFLQDLWKAPWVKAREYRGIKGKNGHIAPGGLYLLSKLPLSKISFHTLPGRLGRGALIATANVRGHPVTIAVVHLESFLADGPVRARQLSTVFPLISASEDAILAGDFNFGTGAKPESDHIPATYTDAWIALRPRRPGFTWDMTKNGLARKGSLPGESSRRLDRVLVRSKRWRATGIELVGSRPVRPEDDRLFPSDHFGLRAAFSSAPR